MDGGDPRLGTVLQGRYRIVERLAAGGMGVVYRGERVKLERPVAIKFLHATFAVESLPMKRFEREAIIMGRLAHPNCVSVIDVGIDSTPYIVMDYISGRTLKALLDDGPVPPGRAIYIVRQILSALAHAHRLNIVHRDVKPANVIIADAEGTRDHVYVLDFGLAKFRESAGKDDLTGSAALIGTPSYMSPEQARGEKAAVASDLYSVGVLLFELIAGHNPFRSESALETLLNHQNAPVPRLGDEIPTGELPAGIDDILTRSLAKDMDERFASALEFAHALDRLVSKHGMPPWLPAEPPGGRRGELDTLTTVNPVASADEPSGAPAAQRIPPGKTGKSAVPVTLITAAGKAGQKLSAKAARKAARAVKAVPIALKTTAPPAAQAGKPARPDSDHAGQRDRLDAAAGAIAVPADASADKLAELTEKVVAEGLLAVDTMTTVFEPGESTTGVSLIDNRYASRWGVAALLIVLACSSGLVSWYLLQRRDHTAGVAADEPPAVAAAAAPAGAELAHAERAAAAIDASPPVPDSAPATASATQPVDHGAGTPPGMTIDASPGAATVSKAPAAVPARKPIEVKTPHDVVVLIQQGQREQAIAGIQKLMPSHSKSAYLPFLLGNLYFEKMWWSDGLSAYRQALRNNATAYAGKSEINNNAILALSSDKTQAKASTLIVKSIGKPAIPYLRTAAQEHDNSVVRRRAAALLRRLGAK